MPNPAAVAYEAYRAANNCPQNMPLWSELSSKEKDLWWAVIRAVLSNYEGA